MATWEKTASGKYKVRWAEPSVTLGEDGQEIKSWIWRSRTVATEAEAKHLSVAVEAAAGQGKNWRDPRLDAVATIRAAALGYVRAAVDGGAPVATQRHRSSLLGSFLSWLGASQEDDPGASRRVGDLSLELLERYAASLPSEGRQASTKHRKVLMVEQMWRWASERPEKFPGVPTPRRLTGGAYDADRLHAPPAVVALDAPRWADVDAMIRQLRVLWHVRVATLMRFTGLRASQALNLKGSDVDLANGVLRVRAGVAGAKKGRTRVVPLHPALSAEIARWEIGPGFVFARARLPGIPGPAPLHDDSPPRSDSLPEPFRRAWLLAGVPRERWDTVDLEERARGAPTHAIRRCMRTELIRAGVEEAIALYLIGHTQGVTAAAYVPERNPEASPYWPRLIEALATIPPITVPDNVIRLADTQKSAK